MKLDNHGIDIGILRKWMLLCSELHGRRCDWKPTALETKAERPKYLIDVEYMNLVPAQSGQQYVALSYVWGDVPSSYATMENLPMLLETGSFTKPTITLPQLILDAMDLVRDLHLRYLWVDKFCIPQDDGLEKLQQLDAMGSIYARAQLTIFAAEDQDASQGLYGQRKLIDAARGPSSRRASASRPAYHGPDGRLTNETLLLRNARDLMCTRWFSRGWTFQESLLSSRRILFHNGTVGWECQAASWHEAQDLTDLLDVDIPLLESDPAGIHQMVLSPWPDMYRYARLVSLYNRHALTYPEDVSDAFRGILSLLSCSFTGALISGLPEMFFNAALLWQPWYPMTRRRSKRQSREEAVLPSWSWTGWHGDMGTESWTTAYNYIRPTLGRGVENGDITGWRTVSTVDWYYSETLNGERRKVADSSQELQKLVDKPAELLRHGWKRFRDNHGNILYRHQADAQRHFWYPIPVLDEQKTSSALIDARYIHAKTRSATFKLGKLYGTRSSNCDAVDLISELDNKWSGCLRLSLRSKDSHRLRAERCELVELSAGHFRGGRSGEWFLDEWEREPSLKDGYEFYNVACVKWKGPPGSRVAYRRALGRVKKSKWDAVAREIDLTLG